MIVQCLEYSCVAHPRKVHNGTLGLGDKNPFKNNNIITTIVSNRTLFTKIVFLYARVTTIMMMQQYDTEQYRTM